MLSFENHQSSDISHHSDSIHYTRNKRVKLIDITMLPLFIKSLIVRMQNTEHERNDYFACICTQYGLGWNLSVVSEEMLITLKYHMFSMTFFENQNHTTVQAIVCQLFIDENAIDVGFGFSPVQCKVSYD